MTHRDLTDRELDELFADARAAPAPELSETLAARIIGDALRDMPDTPAMPARRSLWGALRAAIGGWPSLGGMAAAGIAGLWIGIAPPQAIADLAASYTGDAVSVTVYSDTTFAAVGG